MKARRSVGVVTALGAAFLFGCASIVGIGDLNPPDGGHTSGSSSGATGTCSPPGGAACQIDPQCGCGTDEKCDFTSASGASCVAVGTGTSGALCQVPTDCAAGLTCILGVCHPYCDNAGNQCPAAASGPPVSLCLQATDNGVEIPQAEYCLFDCTPVPNNCPTGEACVVVELTLSSGTVNATNCEVPGTGGAGATCTDGNIDCQAGYECDTSNGETLCVKFCRSASDCVGVGSGTCDLATGLVIDGITYGFCE